MTTTNGSDEDYVHRQREAVRPFECTQDPQCWAAIGGKAALEPGSMQKTPRCNACHGKLLLGFWRTPAALSLTPHGRLRRRTVETNNQCRGKASRSSINA